MITVLLHSNVVYYCYSLDKPSPSPAASVITSEQPTAPLNIVPSSTTSNLFTTTPLSLHLTTALNGQSVTSQL